MALLAGNGYLCGAQIEAVILLNNPSYVPQRSVFFLCNSPQFRILLRAGIRVESNLLCPEFHPSPRSKLISETVTAGKVPSFSGRLYSWPS